jgi:hypothetical protein
LRQRLAQISNSGRGVVPIGDEILPAELIDTTVESGSTPSPTILNTPVFKRITSGAGVVTTS